MTETQPKEYDVIIIGSGATGAGTARDCAMRGLKTLRPQSYFNPRGGFGIKPKQNMEKFILALDQGTTSSRAIVFDHEGNIRSVAQHEFPQIFPHSGWVEHDPLQIWGSQASEIASAISKIGINGHNIAGIGTTNQRETTIVWDRETGEPVYNTIVWQDRRTSEYCDSLVEEGHAEMIREKTGLIIDAYFSATKIKWILDNVPGARERAEVGKLCFGTVDSWLVSCLTPTQFM